MPNKFQLLAISAIAIAALVVPGELRAQAAAAAGSSATMMQDTSSAPTQDVFQGGAASGMSSGMSSGMASSPSMQGSAPASSPYPHREAQIANGKTMAAALPASMKIPDEGSHTLHVIVGRSLFVNTPDRLRRIFVSNPAVIDSMSTSPKEVVITAKSPGTSSLVLWNEEGVSTVLTVLSDVDVAGLRESLAQALPADHIDVQVQEGRLFLSGVVGSDNEADIATRLTSVYSKDIVNSLIVDPRHRPQVRLKVRFAELDRSKLDTLGLNIFALSPKGIGSGTTQQFGPPSFQTGSGGSGSSNQTTLQFSNFLNLFYFDPLNGVGASLQDLQTKGVLEILADPTLMAIDGQPAKFLAGGEFPFPVVQPGTSGGAASVTITFKPFGVKLEFIPYVNPDGTIRLKVRPEVSALDYTNVVVIAGYTVPSITTRVAETQVELKDGQTFGISGILDRRTTDTFNKMPGIGDIPILGQLFRSKSQNHSVMELVVVVTPEIVDPLTTDEAVKTHPKWTTPPGALGNFDKGLPKNYQNDGQPPAQPQGQNSMQNQNSGQKQ